MALNKALFGALSGLKYYSAAAVFNLSMIIILSWISPVTKMVIFAQQVLTVAIIITFARFAIWVVFLSRVVSSTESSKDVVRHGMGSRSADIFISNCSIFFNYCKNETSA